jgi:hypothetical protein
MRANVNHAEKLEAAARCYVNLLISQMNTDASNAALWSYSGAVYDEVNGVQFCSARDYRASIADRLTRWRILGLKTPAAQQV